MLGKADSVVIGIDLGTSGVRAVAVDAQGRIAAEGTAPLNCEVKGLPAGWFEQEMAPWWAAACAALRQTTTHLAGAPVEAIGVSGTSGTLCALDDAGAPVRPAVMYSDSRSRHEAAEAQAAGTEVAAALGYRFSPSFALPKLLWVLRHEPDVAARARWFLSPSDWLIGRLSGAWGVSDWTNALKWGYDVRRGAWPEYMRDLGVPVERLPRVSAPGAQVGGVTAPAAAQTGLPPGAPVLAGVTDGCGSQFSTGAVAPGEWNSTLGTTLVVKGVSTELLRDPLGRLYSHRHPEGHWLPGAASTTGGEAIASRFAAGELDALNAVALQCAPTDLIVYPLVRRGERFPFVAPEAEGFVLGQAEDRAIFYAAHLEGVAYVERLAYQVLEQIGLPVGPDLYAAGGANRSAAWLQLRADITGKRLRVPRTSGAAMGAALLAAASAWHGSLSEAARAMVHIEREVEPRPHLRAAYDERYGRFLCELERRGYWAGIGD
ncbi:MAG: FGGY-family carbohydrate kinase [Anaerolineae bacterium]